LTKSRQKLKNADTKYGKHLLPLPLCFASAPEETQLQPCEDSAIEISMPKFKSAVIEQREMQKEVLTGVIIPKLKFIIYKN